jgi:hypothetical protein
MSWILFLYLCCSVLRTKLNKRSPRQMLKCSRKIGMKCYSIFTSALFLLRFSTNEKIKCGTINIQAITVAARSKPWTIFASSNAGIVGSNPIQGMDFLCVRLFCVLLCVGSGLATGCHSSKESYSLCKKDYQTEEEARAQQRAVKPFMNEWTN